EPHAISFDDITTRKLRLGRFPVQINLLYVINLPWIVIIAIQAKVIPTGYSTISFFQPTNSDQNLLCIKPKVCGDDG
ncbi:MAG: hypothetical protein PWP64_1084, partial [Candidatus Cloacimonadota bacterium]|nr:hypothetical protein [Candidatus Cloacimonadota bacterium]